MEAVVVVVVVVVVVALKVMLRTLFTFLQVAEDYAARFLVKILFSIVPPYKFNGNLFLG